jgi:hypothetical protein
VNVEDLIRSQLHDEANTVAPIDGLLETSTQLGRRKQRGRRLAVAGSSVAAAAIVVGGSLVLAGGGSNPTHTVKINPASSQHPKTKAKANSDADVAPWWDTWTQDRHFGPVDQAFLTNARPTYDTAKGPEPITVWASGSESDGTDWVMFTDPHDGHQIQYYQGWNGTPDYGESPQVDQPAITWDSFTSPTLDSHNDVNSTSQFLIIVGKPGTTSIKYAADGTSFVDEPVQDGISVIKVANFPAATAKVQLATADGVYATGTPKGAGGATNTAVTDGPPGNGPGTANPTATPTGASTEAPAAKQ